MQALFSSSISLKVSLSKSMFLQTFLFVRFFFCKYLFQKIYISTSIALCKHLFLQIFLYASISCSVSQLLLQASFSPNISFFKHLFLRTLLSASIFSPSITFFKTPACIFLQRFLSTKHLFLQVFLHTFAVNFSYTNPFPWF